MLFTDNSRDTYGVAYFSRTHQLQEVEGTKYEIVQEGRLTASEVLYVGAVWIELHPAMGNTFDDAIDVNDLPGLEHQWL